MKDYNEFWMDIKGLHSRHPSVRFRNHLIVGAVRRILDPLKDNSVLDIGCGNGDLLKELERLLCLDRDRLILSGYDISQYQIEKNKLQGLPFDFRVADFNGRVDVSSKFDIIICSELIEHLKDWKSSLQNMADMNKQGGCIILTTQSGRRFKSDKALGHLQHFQLDHLVDYLRKLNYDIIKAERRGFPFYNLQKMANSIFFNMAERVAHDKTNFSASLLFSCTYFLFRISLSSKSLGPQIFILGQKKY